MLAHSGRLGTWSLKMFNTTTRQIEPSYYELKALVAKLEAQVKALEAELKELKQDREATK